eukprot:5001626-Amphidinium_carterae.1
MQEEQLVKGFLHPQAQLVKGFCFHLAAVSRKCSEVGIRTALRSQDASCASPHDCAISRDKVELLLGVPMLRFLIFWVRRSTSGHLADEETVDWMSKHVGLQSKSEPTKRVIS